MLSKRQVSIMEKVKCTKCGSVGYTASPESVRCSECGGRHKVIVMTKGNNKPVRPESISFLKGFTAGNDSPGTFYPFVSPSLAD